MDAARMLGSLIGGYRAPAIIGTAARLGLADHIAAGATTVAELAAATSTRRGRLTQVLHALVALGVLRVDDESYVLTPMGDLLRSDHPSSRRQAAIYASMVSMRAFSSLYDSMMTTECAFEVAFGKPFYDVVNADIDLFSAFSGMLASESLGQAVTDTYDFADKCIVDVGGGDGTLLKAILGHQKAARGMLFELPDVLATARPAADVDSRIEYRAGSFLTDDLPVGDVYILARSYSAGASAGGSQAPVVNSLRRASSLFRPHLVAVSR